MTNYYKIMKKFLLQLWPQPTSRWLELMIDNIGMQKDPEKEQVVKILKKAGFTDKELEILVADLNHSASRVMYNPQTDNGAQYDIDVYRRYVEAMNFVRSCITPKPLKRVSL